MPKRRRKYTKSSEYLLDNAIKLCFLPSQPNSIELSQDLMSLPKHGQSREDVIPNDFDTEKHHSAKQSEYRRGLAVVDLLPELLESPVVSLQGIGVMRVEAIGTDQMTVSSHLLSSFHALEGVQVLRMLIQR